MGTTVILPELSPGFPPTLLPPLHPSTTHLRLGVSLLTPPWLTRPSVAFPIHPVVGGGVVTMVIVRQCKPDPIILLTEKKKSLQCYKIKLESPAKLWSLPFLILASFLRYPPPPLPRRAQTWGCPRPRPKPGRLLQLQCAQPRRGDDNGVYPASTRQACGGLRGPWHVWAVLSRSGAQSFHSYPRLWNACLPLVSDSGGLAGN